MIESWSSAYTIFFLTSCMLIGVGVGFLLRSIGNIGRINKAVEEFKKEAEAEKLEISRDLNKQLVQVKESIIKTVEAYSSVARTIQERLPIPPEFEALHSNNSDALRLEVMQVSDEKRKDIAKDVQIETESSNNSEVRQIETVDQADVGIVDNSITSDFNSNLSPLGQKHGSLESTQDDIHNVPRKISVG